MNCDLVLYSGPLIEPVSLADLKQHMRLNTGGTFSDEVTETQSIAPGSHTITTAYDIEGASVDVLGYESVVALQAGANGTSGTVDVKIQESDDEATWTDWTGGAFTQVTEATDNTTYQKQYTGTKQYIRTVGKVLVAACQFGTTVITRSPETAEDDILTACIAAARQWIEERVTWRRLITQTWDMHLDEFPADDDFIGIPYGNLQSVTFFKYKDCEGTETTLTENTDYLVETNGDRCGRIVLPYEGSWPDATFYPSHPITVRFKCGYGDTAATVPQMIRTAVKMVAADLAKYREAKIDWQTYENNWIANLLERLWW